MRTRRTILASLAIAALGAQFKGAAADVYPSRPITVVVPFPAGGPTDTIARIVSERMSTFLGQPLVIENVTGAGGTIGTGRVARAAPDGYTLCVGFLGTHVLNGAVYTLQYDVTKDFEPVALLASNPQLIVAKKSTPAKDLKEFIALLKANPGKAIQGSAGIGSPSHVSGEYFGRASGTTFQFAQYRGAAPAMQDLVGEHIDLMFDQPPNSLPQVRSGNIKAYAVTAKKRLSSAPDIPTVDEAGLPDSISLSGRGCGLPGARPKPSFPNSTLPLSTRWRTQPSNVAWTIWARRRQNAVNKLLQPLLPSRRPRSKSGGRLSELPGSKRNKQAVRGINVCFGSNATGSVHTESRSMSASLRK